MKKYIAGMLVAAAALVASAAPSWAGPITSVKITTVTAQTTTGGVRLAAFTLAIRNVSAPFGANVGTVTWSGVDPLTTTWKLADQLLVINSTITDNNGGIKIYTDNTAADANPRFNPPLPSTSTNVANFAAGLLNNTSTFTSLSPLPMAWTVKPGTRTIESGTDQTGVGAADPQTGPIGTVYNQRFQWLNMTDEFNWANGIDFNGDGDVLDAGDAGHLEPDAKFPVMISKAGVHYGQADTEFGPPVQGKNAFVYFEANFSTADVQTLYKTNTIRVEAFIQ